MPTETNGNILANNQNKKNKKTPAKGCLFIFEPLAGLEPATHALRMRCATNCATEAFKNALDRKSKAYDLTGNRTRVYGVRGRRLDRLTMRP